ncbi:hypothetical protein LCGC14_1671190 [marine sediment metagenome]|uniref:Uncharacterized protein n=1 Tax=marine sediment metagenome TaxID=412755 RepID=A0A0F9K727_9ZZZZ
MTDVPKDLGKNADRSYDDAPTVHPDAVSGSGELHLQHGKAVSTAWIPVTAQLPSPHETVLARDEIGDIYQARVCFRKHAPWWCGHSRLNFGVILKVEGITIKEWRHLG